MTQKINCLLCKHYYATWDNAAPRGCRLYGFKTREIPAHSVKRESGDECRGFDLRADKSKEKEEGEIDFNDPKYW